MKILITGATGFIGKELVKSIKKKIWCLVRKKKNFPEKSVRSIMCDLNDREKLLKCVNGFDVVVHLAGIVNASSDQEFYNKNVLLTENLLDACKANKVKRFIFISTAVVISKVQGPYSRSKIAAEELVRKSGIEYVILRPSVVYGKEDEKNIGGLIKMVSPGIFWKNGFQNMAI